MYSGPVLKSAHMPSSVNGYCALDIQANISIPDQTVVNGLHVVVRDVIECLICKVHGCFKQVFALFFIHPGSVDECRGYFHSQFPSCALYVAG